MAFFSGTVKHVAPLAPHFVTRFHTFIITETMAGIRQPHRVVQQEVIRPSPRNPFVAVSFVVPLPSMRPFLEPFEYILAMGHFRDAFAHCQ
jgi:hypothetical protein